MEGSRINFTKAVKRVIGERANFQCAIPRCKNPAIGPSSSKVNSSTNMGVACHIFSAAEKGPRGRQGLHANWIKTPDNGLWCCAYHAGLIDKHRGSDYPGEKLLAWKQLIEARVAKQMDGFPSPLGWVETIEITKSKIFSLQPKINLGRRTLIYNKPANGMSFLLEMTAGCSNADYAWRWVENSDCEKQYHHTPEALVTYSTVDYLNQSLQVKCNNGSIYRYRNGVKLLRPPYDLDVTFYSENSFWNHRHDEDDLQFLKRVLNVDKGTLVSLFERQSDPHSSLLPGDYKFRRAYEYNDDDELRAKYHEDGERWVELACKINGRDDFVSYGNLSRSEVSRFLISLTVAKAHEMSRSCLTLLVLDINGSNLDESNFLKLIGFVSDDEYQVVISIPKWRVGNILDGENESQFKLKKLDELFGWEFRVLITEQ